ncbi:non-specific lipid-transfer protein 1-like [Carex rostrata]
MACFDIRATTAAAVAILLLTVPHAASAINCLEVLATMRPCLDYLNDRASLSEACCSSVKSLNSMVTESEKVCYCLDNIATWGSDTSLLACLPEKCGVVSMCSNIGVSTDCSKYGIC